MLYRTAYIYVKNENDALDIVQETAYRSLKSLHQLKEPKYFKTWLTRIAINTSLDFLRKKEKLVPFPLEITGDSTPRLDDKIVLHVTLEQLIDTLSSAEKSVIILRFYHDHTIKEVAEILNLPLGSAKTILYRALKILRVRLKEGQADEK